MVLAVIFLQLIGLAVQRKSRAADTVRVSADERADITASFFVTLSVIIAERDVTQIAVFIRCSNTLYRTAVVDDPDLYAAVVHQSIFCDRSAVRKCTERLSGYVDHGLSALSLIILDDLLNIGEEFLFLADGERIFFENIHHLIRRLDHVIMLGDKYFQKV